MSDLTANERLAALAFLAGELVTVHQHTPREVNHHTHLALINVRDEMQTIAWSLETGIEVGRERNLSRLLWFIKYRWITGREPGADNQWCTHEITSGVVPRHCRNRPLMGVEHCHKHASEEERELVKAKAEQWEAHRDAVMARHNIDGINAVISSVISGEEPTDV